MAATTSERSSVTGARHGFLAVVLLVCVLFTVSGAVGLVYQVAWKHLFTTVFGSTTYAVSVVISIFMGGLALGSFAFGRVADRSRAHLLIFAALQAGIGACGLVVPPVLQWAEGLYGGVFRATGSPGALLAVQVLVSTCVLLAPTFLMGGTLPVLSRLMASLRGRVGPAVGLLYGLNTLGAAGGAFLTGFVLVKELGIRRTIHLAAAGNFALALAFLLMHLLSTVEEEVALAEEPGPPGELALGRWRLRLVMLMVAVSGFVAFSYEVLWTRLLTFRFETTVYAFSIMLSTFLLGLGLGGALVGLLRRRIPKARYWLVWGCLEAGVGVYGVSSVLLFFSARHGYESFAMRVLGEFGVSALIMLVPTTMMGAAFPIACELFAAGVAETGKSVGRIYVFNTVGAIAGALVTGFVLVRTLGTQASLTLVSLLMVGAGSVVLAATPGLARRRAWLRFAPAAAAWAGALLVWALTPGDFLLHYFLKNQSFAAANPEGSARLIGYEEGVEGVVVVSADEEGTRMIAAGPLDVAGTSYALRNTQKLQAHVPMLLHPDPREVCQIGFGGGETAGIFASYDVDRFDCIEISRAMIQVADEHFSDINRGVVDDPKCNLIVMDATTYLKYTERKYDVIANDATWPAQAGPSMLYTLEHFQNGYDRLKPGGIMTSWLPFDMPIEDLKAIIRNFHQTFRHVYIWAVLSRVNKHSLILGTDEPLRVDAARFLERFEQFARDDLAIVHLDDPDVFLACHLTRIEGPAPELAGAPPHTQDRPTLQFLYSRQEEYARYREPRQRSQALLFFRAHRDSILEHLGGLDALPQGQQLAEGIARVDRANDHFLRAHVLEWEDPRRSAEELMAAARLAPNHPAVRVETASRAALAALDREQLRRLSTEDLKATAGHLFLQGQYRKALVALEEWARREPQSATAQAEIGLVYINMDRPDLAIPHLRMAVSLDPESADAQFNLGSAYLAAARPAQAVTHLESARRMEPHSPDTLERLGLAYALVERPDRAGPLLERAVELSPELPRARQNLAAFLARQGRFEAALPHLQKLVELRPDAHQAHRLLAQTYRRLGRTEDAREHERRAEALEAAHEGAPAP